MSHASSPPPRSALPEPRPDQPRAARGPALRAAMLAVMAWVVSLLVMGAMQARTIPLGRDQLLRADAVVTGSPRDDGHRLHVTQVWSGSITVGTDIDVANLPDALRRLNDSGTGELIVPLSLSGRQYRVTMLEGQRAAPLVYPANPSLTATARTIVRSARPLAR